MFIFDITMFMDINLNRKTKEDESRGSIYEFLKI